LNPADNNRYLQQVMLNQQMTSVQAAAQSSSERKRRINPQHSLDISSRKNAAGMLVDYNDPHISVSNDTRLSHVCIR
jgi:hypothetical protein